MATVKIRHLIEKPGKDGRRFFWQPSSDLRKLGWRMERLPDDRMMAMARAEDLNRQLDAWRKGETIPVGEKGGPKQQLETRQPGTIGALITSYKSDGRYIKKAEKTKQGYSWALNIIEEWADQGRVPVRAITSKRIQVFYKAMYATTPAKANAVMRVLHLLFEHARREDMIEINPASKAGTIATAPRIRVLSLDEIDALLAHADALGLPSIGDAILMGQQLGQRQGDILSRTWLGYQDNAFLIRQRKTGAIVKLPASPRLQLRLEAARKRQADKLKDEDEGRYTKSGFIIALDLSGGRYQGKTFNHLFARVRAAAAGQPEDHKDAAATRQLAKVPSLLGQKATELEPEILPAWYMDLRDTCVTMMADAGCTVPEIASITGHTPDSVYRVLRHYLANSAIQASNAIAKLVTHEDQLRALRQPQKEA